MFVIQAAMLTRGNVFKVMIVPAKPLAFDLRQGFALKALHDRILNVSVITRFNYSKQCFIVLIFLTLQFILRTSKLEQSLAKYLEVYSGRKYDWLMEYSF